MTRKLLIVGAILVLALGGWAAQETTKPDREGQATNPPAESSVAQQKDSSQISPVTGSALLDLFLDHLREMAQMGKPEVLEPRLQEMMIAAKKAREAKTIDPVFFRRFNRMLAVTKIIATPDWSGVLGPVIEQVLGDFVLDKLGLQGFREEGGKGPKAINWVAQALASEIIDLQIYLDTFGQRQALQKKIEERMAMPPKK
jgi:hypothetical protein